METGVQLYETDIEVLCSVRDAFEGFKLLYILDQSVYTIINNYMAINNLTLSYEMSRMTIVCY